MPRILKISENLAKSKTRVLSAFHQVHGVLERSPLAKAWGVLSFAALGMFSAEFGANDRALLVSWSSHRLLARPAQNAVSSDFLWSCIIFPCFLYNCGSFWSLPSLYGRLFKRPVLQTCGRAMSAVGGVPVVTPMEAHGSTLPRGNLRQRGRVSVPTWLKAIKVAAAASWGDKREARLQIECASEIRAAVALISVTSTGLYWGWGRQCAMKAHFQSALKFLVLLVVPQLNVLTFALKTCSGYRVLKTTIGVSGRSFRKQYFHADGF